MNNTKISPKLKYIIPLLHWCLSFIYERLLFKYGEIGVMYTEPLKPEVISAQGEYIMTYCVTKAFAALFIFLFWHMIFKFFNRETSKDIKITFGLFFLAGLIVVLAMWPESFAISVDNYITFAYSTRFIPFYWHHFFTGCVYGGMMMIFPSPISIQIFQWMCLTFALAYVFFRMKNSNRVHRNLRYGILLFVFVPEAYELAVNPYRNSLYAILCVFFFTIIIFDSLDETAFKLRRIAGIMVLGSFVTLWRSEGIVLGILGMIILMFTAYKSLKPAYKAAIVAGFFLMLYVFSIPQKIGEEKYYGNDYLIVSTMRPLQFIFNYDNNNLNYDGAKDDIAAIDAIVPIEYVKKWSLIGYMTNNREEGREDVDQSFASDEEKSAFIKAFARLVLHNPKPYLISQANFFLKASGIDYLFTEPVYSKEITGEPNFYLSMWDQGKEEYDRALFVTAMEKSSIRIKAASFITKVQRRYYRILDEWMTAWIHVLTFALSLFTVVYELVRFIKKDYSKTVFGLVSLLWLGELAIVFLAMPYSYSIYIYPFAFCMYTILFLYAVTSFRRKY